MTLFLDDGDVRILLGDARVALADVADNSVQCVATSPPFFGLRDYGTGRWEGGDDPECDHERPAGTMNVGFNERWHGDGAGAGGKCQERKSGGQYAGLCPKCGAARIDSQIGLEATPDAWASAIVEVMREARRVLRPDGSLWVECGDSYAANRSYQVPDSKHRDVGNGRGAIVPDGMKPTDLVGAPWLLAFALRADGWYLRGAYVWEKPDCLSGGTRIYARTQKGDMPMTVKDLVRLDPSTVQLWNGKGWTQAVGWRNAGTRTDALEVELRSGERIGCTPNHLWPTDRGLVLAKDLVPGDIVPRGPLPAPTTPISPAGLPDEDIGWLCGLYLAEGSRKDGMVRFACHADEAAALYARLEPLARRYHGTARSYLTGGKSAAVHVASRVLEAAISLYVGGGTSKTKKLRTAAWQRNESFLKALFDGYLFGDGHYDAKNDRWRLGFTRNDALASDLRCLSARCGYDLRLRTCYVRRGDERWPAYRGDLRLRQAVGANRKDSGEVVAIRRSRGRQFWDISVADEPHLYALASGTLTHNCMPESVENRCTTSHSFVFHLTKSSEDAVFWTHRDGRGARAKPKADYRWIHRETGAETADPQTGREWKRVNLWRGRPYFFDRDAIREPFSDYSTGGDGGSYGARADAERVWNGGSRGSTRYERPRGEGDYVQPTLDGDVTEAEVRGPDGRKNLAAKTGPNAHENYAGRDGNSRWPSLEGRSPRSVWRITTEASSFGLCRVCRTYWPERAPARHCGEDVVAHFAVWPHELVAKIINAATSEAGCCADCGAPRVRRTKTQRTFDGEPIVGGAFASHANGDSKAPGREGVGHWRFRTEVEDLGWQASCECDAASVPCVVLDVFGGSGTTARQARAMGRHAILVELSPDYAEIAAHRLAQQGLALV